MARTRRGPTSHLMTLTSAQTAGQAGTWAGYVAAVPAALAQPHPAVALSFIAAAWGIPSIAAWLAGRAADRYGPHRTGAVAWSLAAAAAAVPAVTRPGLPVLLVVLAVLSLGGTWGVAAGEAAPTWLPGLADPAEAGPWLAIATNLSLVIGPPGAALLGHVSDRAAWGLVAGLSAAAAIGTLLVPASPPEPGMVPARRPRTQLPPVIRRVLVLTASVYLTIGSITILEPLYVRQILRSPLTVYGWLLTAAGIAGILTSLAAKRWPVIVDGQWSIPVATLTLAAGTVLYVNTAILACAFAGAAVFGAGTALFRLAVRAIIVRTIPARAHGHALGRWETVQCSSSILPTAFTGTLVTVLGLRVVLSSCGAFATAVATASLRPAPGASGNRRQSRNSSTSQDAIACRKVTGDIPASSRRQWDPADQQLSSLITSGGPWKQPHRQPEPAWLDPDRFRLPPTHPAPREPVPPRDLGGPTAPL